MTTTTWIETEETATRRHLVPSEVGTMNDGTDPLRAPAPTSTIADARARRRVVLRGLALHLDRLDTGRDRSDVLQLLFLGGVRQQQRRGGRRGREGRRVRGSLRLMPTTGPTVLSEVFSDTMPDAVMLSAPSIWECTRFCVDELVVGTRQRDQIVASGALISALGTVALEAGIESVLGNFDTAMLRFPVNNFASVTRPSSSWRNFEPGVAASNTSRANRSEKPATGSW